MFEVIVLIILLLVLKYIIFISKKKKKNSGAFINIIDESTFNKIKPRPLLAQTKIKVFPYQSKTPLQLKGTFNSLIESSSKFVSAPIIVLKGERKAILCRQTATRRATKNCQHLKLTWFTWQHSTNHWPKSTNFQRSRFVEKSNHISILISQQPICRIRWHTRQKVADEVKTITKARHHREIRWSNVMAQPIRSCSSQIQLASSTMPRHAKGKQRSHSWTSRHPKIRWDSTGDAKIFSKIVLREGYHRYSYIQTLMKEFFTARN